MLPNFITGEIAFKGSVATGDPGAGSGKGKLGKLVAGVVAPDAANYIEVDIDGTVYKLIKAT